MKNNILFDLILQNCGSKQIYIYKKLVNISENPSYLTFNLDLDNIPSGDYNYSLFIDNRNDTEFIIKSDLTQSIVMTGEGNVKMSALNPMLGILRICDKIEEPIAYEEVLKEEEYKVNNNLYFYLD